MTISLTTEKAPYGAFSVVSSQTFLKLLKMRGGPGKYFEAYL